jgi:hypothetical protein
MTDLFKPLHYLLISISALFAGVLFYGMYNGFIIVQFPMQKPPLALKDLEVQKKRFKLFYYKQGKWLYEERDLLSSDNKLKTLNYLIASWLTVLEEEQILDKKISLQSLLLDQFNNEAFISFDRSIFGKNMSTYQKLLLIEGLLKTLKDTGIPLQTVRILVHNKPLQDSHLDFSQPWPLTGYLQKQ